MIEAVDDLARWLEHAHGTARVVDWPWTAIAPTASGAWTLGAYAQIVAANVLAGHALVAAFCTDQHNSTSLQAEIGVGAAGSEVVVGRFGLSEYSTDVWLRRPFYIQPVIHIPKNARVAVRVAGSGASTAPGLMFGFLPYEF